MKILLVAPIQSFTITDEAKFFKYNFPFYGINILATILRERKHSVNVIDPLSYYLNTGNKYINLAQHVEEEIKNYDVLGISNLASVLNRHCLEIAKIGKKYNKKVIIGGVHPTIAPKYLLTNWLNLIDIVVLKEGENVLPEVLSRIENGNNNLGTSNDLTDIQGIAFVKNGEIVINPKVSRVNMDALPFIDYTQYILPHWRPRSVAINVTRGCSFKCSFCSSSFMWGTIRRRSINHVINEIKNLCTEVKPDKIYINDDIFIPDAEGFGILQEIKRLRMERGYDFELLFRTRFDRARKEFFLLYKEAGGKIIEIGLETSSRLRGKVLKKDLCFENMTSNLNYVKEIGLKIYVFIMLGLPGEKIEDVKEIWQTLRLMNPDGVRVTILHLYPNTPMWETAKKNKKLTEELLLKLGSNKDFLNYVQSEGKLRQIKLWQRLIMETFNKIDMTEELYREQYKSVWSFNKDELEEARELLEAE